MKKLVMTSFFALGSIGLFPSFAGPCDDCFANPQCGGGNTLCCSVVDNTQQCTAYMYWAGNPTLTKQPN